MASRIEDSALIGDCQSAALIGKDGSIDWLCLPRFDSGACFAALLGTPEHGRWKIGPVDPVVGTRRRYRDATMILETELETRDGTVVLIDFMPIRTNIPDAVRIVVGKRGAVPMRMEIAIRCDYGSIVSIPKRRWRRRRRTGVAGPSAARTRARTLRSCNARCSR